MAIAGLEAFVGCLRAPADDRARRNAGEPGALIPVVAPAGATVGAEDTGLIRLFHGFTVVRAELADEITLESVAARRRVQGERFIELVTSKPLLVVAANQRTRTVTGATLPGSFGRSMAVVNNPAGWHPDRARWGYDLGVCW